MTTELRRSSRARKQPKSYAEEQAEAQPAVSKPKTSSKTNPKQRAKTGVQEDDDIKDVSLTNADVNRESDFDDDVNSAPKKKKKKRAKKATIEEEVEGGQLYSHPAHGSIVQWGSKTRKFPKIYVVPEPQRETRTKRDDGGKEEKNVDRLNDAGEVAVRRELAKIKKLKPGQEEARLRDYEDELPEWYDRFLDSASKQKMCVLERSRGIEEDCHAHHDDCPYEQLKIAGSKGNVYTIHISHLTVCTCPVGVFAGKSKKQCKHVLYVLHHVLKAPKHLAYQAAFLHSELNELFANAPPLPIDTVQDDVKDGNQKEVTGECPICFMDFEDNEAIVWCKAACGNNIHEACFKQWEAMKAKVSCPFCRSEWQYEDKVQQQKTTLTKVKDLGVRGAGGYLNVADQLGYD